MERRQIGITCQAACKILLLLLPFVQRNISFVRISSTKEKTLPCQAIPVMIPIYGSKVLWSWENPRALVIPGCQSRAIWAGFATGYTEPRVPESV